MTQPYIKHCVCACSDIHWGNSTCSGNVSAYCQHLVNIEATGTEGNCLKINSGSFPFKHSSAFPFPYIHKEYEQSREECGLRKPWAPEEAGLELVASYPLETQTPPS